MAVTWWMPGTLAGMSATSCEVRESRVQAILAQPARRWRIGRNTADMLRALLLHPVPDLGRERVTPLLVEVSDEPDRPGHDGKAAADLPWDLELAGDGRDGAGRVDRQPAAQGRARLFGDQLDQLDLAAGEAVLGRDLQEPRHPGVDALVGRMAKPRDELTPLAVRGHDPAGDLAQTSAWLGRRERLLEHPRRLLHGAPVATAQPEQPGGHRGLERLRR